MDIINSLSKIGSSKELDFFLSKNIDSVFQELFNNEQDFLSSNRETIHHYIESNYKIIKELNFDLRCNQVFLDILIDISERLVFSMFFQRFCKIKTRGNNLISIRNEASLLYLRRIRRIEDFEDILPHFLNKLESAYHEEEDSNVWVTYSLINYYKRVVLGFITTNKDYLLKFKNRLENDLLNYSFYNKKLIETLFKINLNETVYDVEIKFNQITKSAFNKHKVPPKEKTTSFFIEEDTAYSDAIKASDACIYEIRDISSKNVHVSTNKTLGRGVNILTDEKQLFQYMFSYGKMHFAKCLYAYKLLGNVFNFNNIKIFDWGAGQGLASMSYLYYLDKKEIQKNINQITLIEPSITAIKRGALHVRKFEEKAVINTTNKRLDELSVNDFYNVMHNDINLHLFSNILDIDNYSTSKLTSLIKKSFKGLNYFVVVSPYITELKNNRIDLFVESFNTTKNFKIFQEENYPKGKWQNGWSMILRIFKIEL